jgi:hypothetical protein
MFTHILIQQRLILHNKFWFLQKVNQPLLKNKPSTPLAAAQ